jgi:hypothetical protein
LENTPVNFALSGSYQRFTIENVSLDTATTRNIAVLIWVDDQDLAAGDTVYIGNVQLEPGPTANVFQYRRMAEEVDLCQRFFCKTYNLDVTPGSTGAVGAIFHPSSKNLSFAGNDAHLNWSFPTRMRVAPTVTPYSYTAGTAAHISDEVGDKNAQAVEPGELFASIRVTENPADNDYYKVHIVADAEL